MNKGVISVLSALVGAATGAGVVGKVSNEKTQKMKSMSDKHLALFSPLCIFSPSQNVPVK